MGNTQNDILDRFYYFKYYNTIFKKILKEFINIKINLIIHKTSIYLSKYFILFKPFCLFLLKEFIKKSLNMILFTRRWFLFILSTFIRM